MTEQNVEIDAITVYFPTGIEATFQPGDAAYPLAQEVDRIATAYAEREQRWHWNLIREQNAIRAQAKAEDILTAVRALLAPRPGRRAEEDVDRLIPVSILRAALSGETPVVSQGPDGDRLNRPEQ